MMRLELEMHLRWYGTRYWILQPSISSTRVRRLVLALGAFLRLVPSCTPV